MAIEKAIKPNKSRKIPAVCRGAAFALIGAAVAAACLMGGSCAARSGAAAAVGAKTISEADVTSYIMAMRETAGVSDDAEWSRWLSENGMTPRMAREQAIGRLVECELTSKAAHDMGLDPKAEDAGSADAGIPKAERDAEAARKAIRDKAVSEGVDEEAAFALMEQHAGELSPTRHVKTILFGSDERQQAEDAAAKLAADPGLFDAVAGENAADGGWTGATAIDESIGRAVAGLARGEASGVIETEHGTYAIAMWTEEHSVAESGARDAPAGLIATFRSIAETQAAAGKTAEAVDRAAAESEITIYPMPRGLPYDIG